MQLLVCGSLVAASRESPAAEIPIPLQIQIFLKIVTYDRSFDSTASTPYEVGIVMRNDDSSECDRSFKQVEEALAGKTIFGRPLAPIKMLLKNGVLSETGRTPGMLVLVGDWRKDGEIVGRYAKEHQVVTFGSNPLLLNSGIVVVMTLEGERPVIHLNLNTARTVGADFHANFLKHCRVIR
ncbi:MAG TPA: YfiR/HmsC family protein [Candidatus Ozemobacteraceae bacterium]|nr:YfiR/HmsC family protein [Candidatus Ozemobacteraceae bacterium]